MIKRLITILFLTTVIGNSMAAFPPHRDGEGGCGAECCAAARHAHEDEPVATISAICCITECPQSAETTNAASAITDLKRQPQPARLAGCIISTPGQDSFLQRARFPISPTRFLYGSPHRYLDIGALLI
jgi:hypothetical protein